MNHAALTSIFSLAIFAAASTAWAHHSFSAEFDSDKPVKITGTVTKVEWTNPHAHFYVDAKDDNGNVINWNFEMGAPLVLQRLGWRRDSIKPGDQITVDAYSAKDGSKVANAKKVTLPDGRNVFAGSSVGEKPQQ